MKLATVIEAYIALQQSPRAVTQTPPGMVTSNSSTFRSELSKP
jgi:hypothetical protein